MEVEAVTSTKDDFATPHEVVRRRRQALLEHDAAGFARLFAPDAVIEMPTATPGAPQRLEGRAIIEEFSRRAVTGMHIDDFKDVAVHETADREVVIAETVTRATLTATGESFTTPSIQVFRVRDGRIVLFRTYAAPPAELTRPGA
jgi:hypothetical protein